MITFGEFGIDYVLDRIVVARGYYRDRRVNHRERIPPRDQIIDLECNGRWFVVRVGSQRYTLFRQNRQCVRCGVEGTKFLLQASELSWRWYDRHKRISYPKPMYRAHFNLFAERNGGHVLMTKDHIVPVSKGGQDLMSNYQTMCSKCNNKKGSREWVPEYGQPGFEVAKHGKRSTGKAIQTVI